MIVGAGYDDRSVRFRTPGVRFIEVDHPTTQRDKRARLDRLGIESSDICFVAVDLAVDSIQDALQDVVDATSSVAFICEAVMPYLRYERVQALLAGPGELCPSAADLYLDPALLPDHPLGQVAFSVVKLLTRLSGEPLRTVLSRQETDRLLATTGWKEQARTTGRQLGMPRLAADSVYLHLSRMG